MRTILLSSLIALAASFGGGPPSTQRLYEKIDATLRRARNQEGGTGARFARSLGNRWTEMEPDKLVEATLVAGKAVLAFVGDSGAAAAPALADATNVTADAADDEPIEELKRSKSSLHRALAKSSGQKQQEAEASVVIVAGDGKTPKPSMLRQLRGKGLFGSKKGKSPGRDSVGDDESGVFLDLGQAAGNTPEPTPIARRTRAGRAVH